MPQRRNEMTTQMRSEPFAYRASYDASGNVQYEGWADPGASEDSAVWVIAKNTYDANNRLTKTEWAGTPAASFTATWSNRATETYS